MSAVTLYRYLYRSCPCRHLVAVLDLRSYKNILSRDRAAPTAGISASAELVSLRNITTIFTKFSEKPSTWFSTKPHAPCCKKCRSGRSHSVHRTPTEAARTTTRSPLSGCQANRGWGCAHTPATRACQWSANIRLTFTPHVSSGWGILQHWQS